jgi:hypothetical protein
LTSNVFYTGNNHPIPKLAMFTTRLEASWQSDFSHSKSIPEIIVTGVPVNSWFKAKSMPGLGSMSAETVLMGNNPNRKRNKIVVTNIYMDEPVP